MASSGRAWHVRQFVGPMMGFALALATVPIAAAAPPQTNKEGFDVPAQPAVPGFEQVQQAGAPATSVSPEPKPTPKPSFDSTAVAGRYSILRAGGKDTGCMVTLEDGGKRRSGGKAFLSPACRDQGVVIFDPAGWQIVKGQLVLIARKGHKTRLDPQADGTWKKDPKEGKPLILKKM